MEIRCKLVREGGSKIDIDGVIYHFKPADDKEGTPHVCEVKNAEHAKRFLAISEAYEATKPVAAVAPDAEASGETEDADPSDYLITNGAGKEIDLAELSKSELQKFAADEGITLGKALLAKNASKQAVLEAVFAACTED